MSTPFDETVNLPNTITIAGYGATIGWLLGGPSWLAVAGIVADEVDGRAARALGQATSFGSLLDWATDLTLTGLVAQRVGLLPVLPLVTIGQVAMRDAGVSPSVGSARAALTVYALVKERGSGHRGKKLRRGDIG